MASAALVSPASDGEVSDAYGMRKSAKIAMLLSTKADGSGIVVIVKLPSAIKLSNAIKPSGPVTLTSTVP